MGRTEHGRSTVVGGMIRTRSTNQHGCHLQQHTQDKDYTTPLELKPVSCNFKVRGSVSCSEGAATAAIVKMLAFTVPLKGDEN